MIVCGISRSILPIIARVAGLNRMTLDGAAANLLWPIRFSDCWTPGPSLLCAATTDKSEF